ncbi:TMEM175 family protein [Pediococcus argentinicus]|uniref:Integral membrane protein n=1 Tax=Pediococcus argentinicus TaxID=480391 RepID=A0A0R2NHU8_9LACO|nr:TMEM175 family protein [Pediococcus argentinicus]KRO24892.1 integral membrane protein [Pediococcus argentinicus]NKZ22589.1 DUF1211 domain-containing protein [Pediococcus argentinicus]GEP19750.1 ferrochelatase [Pediococcus argentinicus]
MVFNKQRVEALTDAILAIIMTIMILEVHIPIGDSFHALTKSFIPMIAFTISFFSLVNLWMGHHEIFKHVKVVSYSVFWINMILLFWLSMLQVATAWVAEYPRSVIPQVLFCLVGIGWAFLISLLSWQTKLVPESTIQPKFPWHDIWRLSYLWLIGLVLSLFLPYVALLLGIITVFRAAFRLNFV